MTQYEFMKNWCLSRRLDPELHWPDAQRACDATNKDSLTVDIPVTSTPEVAPLPVDPHAALKAQYEEDCKYSEEPWQWREERKPKPLPAKMSHNENVEFLQNELVATKAELARAISEYHDLKTALEHIQDTIAEVTGGAS